jgi:hypothetical protein
MATDDTYPMSPRIDARSLVENNPTACALRDTITHVYLSSELTVAEIRAIVTLGLERGMQLETKPLWLRLPDDNG